MERVIEILEGVKPGVDFRKEEALVDDGILESFELLHLLLN